MAQRPTRELRGKESELYGLKDRAIKQLNVSPGSVWFEYEGKLDRFQYEKSLLYTLKHGTPKFDRTGTDTVGIHGYQSRFRLDDGFPVITSKKIFLRLVIYELLWLIKGDTNIKYLVENNVSIWSDWPLRNYNQRNPDDMLLMDDFHKKILTEPGFAERWGDLGPVYGKQWRDWLTPVEGLPSHVKGIDQIQQVVDMITKQHETGVISRRMLVSAWNVGDLAAMVVSGLPPCHCLFQFHSRLMTINERQAYWTKVNGKDLSWAQDMSDDELDAAGAPVYELDLQLYQRSCDIFLGVPFNIISYSLLLMMMAQVTNTKPGTFIHDYGDLHIYANHLDQVALQLSREPYPYPTMKILNRGQKIDEFSFDDFTLGEYQCHPAIKADVAV